MRLPSLAASGTEAIASRLSMSSSAPTGRLSSSGPCYHSQLMRQRSSGEEFVDRVLLETEFIIEGEGAAVRSKINQDFGSDHACTVHVAERISTNHNVSPNFMHRPCLRKLNGSFWIPDEHASLASTLVHQLGPHKYCKSCGDYCFEAMWCVIATPWQGCS